MKLKVSNNGAAQVPAGSYRGVLEEILVGLMPSQFHENGAATVRFVFALKGGAVNGARLGALANLPLTPDGLRYSERSRFWRFVGNLSGKGVNEAMAAATEVDIPVESVNALPSLISAPVRAEITVNGTSLIGAKAFLIVGMRQRRDGRVVSEIQEVLPDVPL